jgi:predicted CxxxxCH...CXXCH cytochrome family protein
VRELVGAVALVLAASACSKARPLQGAPTQPVSWEEDIAPLFAAQCSACHSGATPPVGYRTTSYLEVLGPQNAPVATAGDTNSPLLRTIDPTRADAVHQPVSAAYEKTRAWVVEGRLSFFRSEVHEGGILNPRDPEFHSGFVRERSWNFAVCQSCHGSDLAGGKVGVSCQQCHSFQVASDGVPTCSSCHGSDQSPAPPRDLACNTSQSARGVGAHQAHVLGRTNISGTIPCETCHTVPATIDSPGHLDHPLPANVIFSGLAVASGASPSWNGTSCSSTYCHGGGSNLSSDTAFRQRTPVWTLGTSQAFCGSCHGIPPSTPLHSGVVFPDCARCHANTVDSNGQILVSGPPGARTSAHINGVIDVAP